MKKRLSLMMKLFFTGLIILGEIAISLAQPLSGTYTIGGTSPNYSTLTAAVSALKNKGVSGTVVFNLRDGIYIEQIVIDSIPGASAANQIIFQSQSQDSTAVTIQYSPYYGNPSVITFNGCKYITFRKLNFYADGNTYANVFRFVSNPSDITIENCIIKGHSATNMNLDLSLCYIMSDVKNLKFLNNLFKDGSYGLYNYAGGENILIQGNIFNDQYAEGIFLRNIKKLEIIANEISSGTANTNYQNIQLDGSAHDLLLSKNRLILHTGYSALSLKDCQATSLNPGLIINNYISCLDGNSNTVEAINVYNSNYLRFYFNSVNISSEKILNSLALRINGYLSSDIHLKNNIFYQSGTGYCVVLNSKNSLSYSDYNNFYSKGGKTISSDNNLYTSILSWRNFSGLDSHSVSYPPDFKSAIDLTPQNYQLDNLGHPISGFSDDIKGQTRSLTTPDIGATEWETPDNDAAVQEIVDSLTFAPGSDSIYIVIKNCGKDTLYSLQIEGSVNNNGLNTYYWQGSLPQGAIYGPFAIAYYDFQLASAYDVSVWCYSPNNKADGLSYNDLKSLTGKYLKLSGTYTIGGKDPDFQNINAAANNLSKGGIVGQVTMKIRDGNYNEQIKFEPIPGADKNRQVIFESESGDSSAVVLYFNTTNLSNNYIVYFNQCSYIRFSKVSMVSKSLNSSYGVVVFIYRSNNIIIENCRLEGISTSSDYKYLSVVYFDGSGLSDNYLINNHIVNGSFGIYLDDNASGMVIEKNYFAGQYQQSLEIINQKNLSIRGNTFTTSTGNGSFISVKLSYSGNNLRLSENLFKLTNGTHAVYMVNCNSDDSTPALICNNFIIITGGASHGHGIYITDCANIKVLHNSIHNIRQNTSSTDMTVTNVTKIQVVNNIFSHTGNGYGIVVSACTQVKQWNYNAFYIASTNFALYNNSQCKDLNNWRLISSWDGNSIFTNPGFASNYDLHICNAKLNSAGIYLPEVENDFDYQPRNTNAPDIGADEFELLKVDLGTDTISCDTVILNASNPGKYYQWSTGEKTQKIKVFKSGKYWVKVTDLSCSAVDTVLVSRKPIGNPVIKGADTLCPADTLSIFTAQTVKGAIDYQWIVPNGWNILSGQGTTSIQVKRNQFSGKICLTAGTACEYTDTVCYQVEVINQMPEIDSVIGLTQVCENEKNIVYEAFTDTNVYQFIWSVPNGWKITKGQGTQRIEVEAGKTDGSICVTPVGLCGKGTPYCINVTVGQIPAQPWHIYGNDTVCASIDIINYYTDTVSHATSYTWEVPEGWKIVHGAGTNNILVDHNGKSGSICVRSVNACGESQRICKHIAILNSPPAPPWISGSDTVCSESRDVVYQAREVSEATHYYWEVPTDWQIVSGQYTSVLTVNIGKYEGNKFIQVSSGNVCGYSKPTEMMVSVYPSPPKPLITQSGDTLISNAESGNQWYADTVMIDGATGQKFLPGKTGLYKVVVTGKNGCQTASDLYYFIHSDLHELSGVNVLVFPNPSVQDVYLVSDQPVQQVMIYNIQGEVVWSVRNSGLTHLLIPRQKPGYYLMQILTMNGEMKSVKLMFTN